jgi:hypothetical protein
MSLFMHFSSKYTYNCSSKDTYNCALQQKVALLLSSRQQDLAAGTVGSSGAVLHSSKGKSSEARNRNVMRSEQDETAEGP